MAAQTVTESIERQIAECTDLMREFLDRYARIQYRPASYDERLIICASSSWLPLSEEGARFQSKLLAAYNRIWSLIDSLMTGQPKDLSSQAQRANEQIRITIEQGSFFAKSIGEVAAEVKEAFAEQIAAVRKLHDSSPCAIYIPDSNALLHNADLDNWRFPDAPKFTLLLIPSVLSELDALKINHRNEEVRKKAESIIRRIKEYRRRGSLHDGVTLSSGISTIRAIAVEPEFDGAPDWLSSDSQDDRILASVFGVHRLHPRSCVVLVTRDINMQNKAEFAAIEFCEPPDP